MRAKGARGIGAAALAATIAAAGSALAQAPHEIPPPVRPLRVRAAEAEAIVVARVERVDAGRMLCARETALRGALPAEFAVKRSPLRPPPLRAGDRALLLLRGARAPYALAGDPAEALRLAPMRGALEDALRAALTADAAAPVQAALWAAAWERAGPHADVRSFAESELAALCDVEAPAVLAAIHAPELAERACGAAARAAAQRQ